MWRDHWKGISRATELLFFMDSKGNVRRVFLACVLHAWGTNLAAVRVFRKRSARNRGISRAIELLFFMDSKGNVRRVFLACVLFGEFFWLVFCMPWAGILLALGCFGLFCGCCFEGLVTKPAGVRVFRKRSARNISWLQEFSCCLRHSVGNVRAVFVAAVLKGWSRNLLVFESFASAPQGTFRGCKSSPCWRLAFSGIP